jgi:streptogramin lyase
MHASDTVTFLNNSVTSPTITITKGSVAIGLYTVTVMGYPTTYSLGLFNGSNREPSDITVGSDNALWIIETFGGQIDRVNAMTGQVTNTYPLTA